MKKRAMMIFTTFLACGIVATSAYAAAVQIISKPASYEITVGTPIQIGLDVRGETEIMPGGVIELAIIPDFQEQTGYNLHIVSLSGTSTAVAGYSEDADNGTWLFSVTGAEDDFFGYDACKAVSLIEYADMQDEGFVTIYVKLNTDPFDNTFYGTTLIITFELQAATQNAA